MSGMNRTQSRRGQPNTALAVQSLYTTHRQLMYVDMQIHVLQSVRKC